MTKPMVVPAAAPPVPVSPSDAEIAEAHRRLLGDSSIQFELKAVDPPQPPPDWLLALGEFLNSIWPLLEMLLWVSLGLFVAWLLYHLAMRLKDGEWRWRRSQRQTDEGESWRPAEAPARQLLAEADALAAAGRYSEAARLLLFRSIEDIEQRQPDLLRPALTSRDIAGLDAIPAQPRGAFSRIAALVERSLFARSDLGEGDWRDCRTAYEEFAFAGGWRG